MAAFSTSKSIAKISINDLTNSIILLINPTNNPLIYSYKSNKWFDTLSKKSCSCVGMASKTSIALLISNGISLANRLFLSSNFAIEVACVAAGCI